VNPVRIVRVDAHNWSVQVWSEGGKETKAKDGTVKVSEPKWVDRSYSGKLEFVIKWAIEEAAEVGAVINNETLRAIEANILKETRAMFLEAGK